MPVYTGSRVTVAQSMLLLMMLFLKHGLTAEALTDVMLVLEIHCLAPNALKCTMSQFNSFFNKYKKQITFYYYCAHCETFFGKREDIPEVCHVCEKETTGCSCSWFISLPIQHQVRELLKDEDAFDSIKNYRWIRRKYPETICDIMDGKVYHKLFDTDGYFKNTAIPDRRTELHISFQLNTDGVSVFHSSSFSLWPVYLLINELDPKLRVQRKYSIFAGLWFGYKKPYFKTFMKPFAEELQMLYRTGMAVDHGRIQRVRCVLLCASFDSPAKCMFMEMTQFNGYYGCPCCLSPGESVTTSERGRTHAYPYDLSSTTGHGELRDHHKTIEDAKEADRTNEKVNGVKGQTWFMYLPGFDFIDGIAVDYMHQLLLGVTKQLCGLWLGKTDAPYSIGHKGTEIDQRISQIKPPNKITRVPRKLSENFGKYKASEWRAFLLFYSLPCLYGILPDLYLEHFTLLVEATRILLGTAILYRDIEKANILLKKFCLQVGDLYGKRHESFNIHLLLHLPRKVYNLGPLWASSLFYFEDLNGELRHFIKGTQRVEMQIIQSVCVQQKVPQMIRQVDDENVKALTQKIQRGSQRYQIKDDVSLSIKVVGAYSQFVPTLAERRALCVKVTRPKLVKKYKRLYHFGIILHSKSYAAVTKRNSYTVSYAEGNDERFGEIEYLLRVSSKCLNESVCNELCDCRIPKHFAMIRKFHIPEEQLLDINGSRLRNIIRVQKTDSLECVNVFDLMEMCVLVNASSGHFVCKFPNNIEKD